MHDLLSTVQPRVYGLCFRILRDRQDSEDATQEVLLKLASRPREIGEVRDLPAWVSRVAITTALDLRRRREARRKAEGRRPAAREDDGAEAREALARALADLDDEPREVLIERYVEGRSLRSMAARRGCTSVAVWYRILRAKARLRDRLVRGGFAGLLGAALACLGAGRSDAAIRTSAGLALGGALLAGGVAAAVAAAARSEPPPPAPVPRRIAEGPPAAVVSDAPAPTPAAAVPEDRSLRARMERLRAWSAASRAAILALEERFKDDPQGLAFAHEPYTREYEALIDGYRAAILAEPAAYLVFLRPIHDERLLDALLFPLTRKPDRTLDDAPETLVQGLAELLVGGSEIQRLVIMRALVSIPDPPPALLAAYDLLLASPTQEVRQTALAALSLGHLRERHRPILEAMALGGGDPWVVHQAVGGLARIPTAHEFLFEQLMASEDPDMLDALAEILPGLVRNEDRADRSVGGLIRAFSQVPRKPVQSEAVHYGSDGYFYRRLVYVTLDGLPADRAREVLAAAVAHAPTVKLREGTRAILTAIDAGETGRNALVAVYVRELDP